MIETLGSLYRQAGHDFPAVQQRGMVPIGAISSETQLYEALAGTPTYTGRTINPTVAMTYSAVWCCVNGISKGLASTSLLTYRNLSPDGLTRELATGDYRYRLLREQPNEEMTSMQWRQFMLASLLLWGNSYNYLDWDDRGRLRAIWPLRPDWVVPMRNSSLRRTYLYQPLLPYAVPVKAGAYEDWQILHIPGLGWDGWLGYSPISMHRQAIALGLSQEEQSGRFIAGGGTQKVALVSPAGTKVADPEKTKADWRKANGGLNNTGDVAILHGGMDVKTFGIPPKDAQYLEGRSWQLAEFARIYDYPLGMLYDGLAKPETYATAEQYDLRLTKHCFRPWAELIEGKIDATILGTNDALTCEHDLEDLYRGDLKSQMEAYQAGVGGMMLRPNEARRRLRLPPDADPGADKLWRQMQMVPIDQPTEPAQKPPATPQQ